MMSAHRADDADDRRRTIIDAALELLAEQGYAGASLRKVAAKVGIAQPSLYHYFPTKEDLVEQVLATYAGEMFQAFDPGSLPQRLEELPRTIVDTALRIYERPRHPLFVRVAFSVSRVNPRYAKLMRSIFVDRAQEGMLLVARPFIDAGELTEAEAVLLISTVIYAIGFHLLEQKVLFDERPLGSATGEHAEFVIEMAETWIRCRRRRDPPSLHRSK
jgi:AcrR family transcriptional regulator